MTPDRQLSWLYLFSAINCLLALIYMSVVSLYWSRSLNTCQILENDYYDHSNCGCILGGSWGEFYFKGGSMTICYFVTLSFAPVVLWSGILALYHGYRACCSVMPIKMTIITKNRVKSVNTQLWPVGLMTFFTLMSASILVLMMTTAVVLFVGYTKTCQQYRKFIVSHLNANGNLARAVYERLPCEVSFDLMDYLQPDPDYLDIRYRRGTWLIDSDLLLKLTMLSNAMTILMYFVITVVNVRCRRMPKETEILNTEL